MKPSARVVAGASGVVAGLVAVWLVQSALSPWSLLPEDTPRVFLDDSYSACQTVYDHVSSDSVTKRPQLLTLPLQYDPEGMSREACLNTLAQLRRGKWLWTTVMPESLACSLLVRDARSFFQENLAFVPAFTIGTRPLSHEETLEVAAGLGLGTSMTEE